jgi:YD repeat-containing protein
MRTRGTMNSNRLFAALNEQTTSSVRPIIRPSSRALRALALLAAITLASATAHAQADFEKGYQAFQSYHGSDFDTVNLANGNLVLNIPLLSYEQRGGVPPVTISIRSNSTTFQSSPQLTGGPADTNQHEVTSGVIGAPWGQPHVMISPGGLFWKEERIVTGHSSTIGSEYLARFVAIDDSGATHSLAGGISNSTAGYIPNIKYSVDGSGLMLQPGTTASGPVIVDRKGNTGGLVDPNGNAITLNGPCAKAPGSGDYFNAALPSWEGYAHGTAAATTITDTVGRKISNPSYLPTVQSYSCLVDIDASYHAVTPDTNNVCPQLSPNNITQGPWSIFQNLPIKSEYYYDKISYPGDRTNGSINLTFCYAQIAVSGGIPQVNGANLNPETINETWWVLTSVQLPNPVTPTYWKFGYDQFGQVDQVIMPTGAMVTYQYAWRLACGNPPGQIPVVGTPIWPYTNILSSPMVTDRYVYLNFTDSSPTEHWVYSNGIGSGWIGAPSAQASTKVVYNTISGVSSGNIESPGGPNAGTVTVTDPLYNSTVHTFSLIGGSTCGPWETKTQYYQGTSQLLKEVDTAYSFTGTDYANPTNFSNYISVGVFPNIVTTEVATNTTPLYSQDQSTYDTFGSYQDYLGITHPFSFGLVRSSSESDWSSSAPGTSKLIPAIRTTLHTKLWQSSGSYYAKNLIDLPNQDTVLAGGTQAAQTRYGYDASGKTWGLQTSVTRWVNTSPVSYVTTQSVYDTEPLISNMSSSGSLSLQGTNCANNNKLFGMPTQKIDANQNKTYLTYDCSGLYLSKIYYPDLSSEFPTYDDNTGLLVYHTDVNSQTTNYSYDTMRRLTKVIYPDTGWETLAYTDSIGSLSVAFNKAITPSLLLTKKAFADGLGRLTQTQLTSDPDGTDYTGTGYDVLGRVCAVSNPTRVNPQPNSPNVGLLCAPGTNPTSGSSPTDGYTYYSYDALSRKAIVTNPDGTTKQACFNGIMTVGQTNCLPNKSGIPVAWEDDADENGNDWQRTQNALGQMTHVLEPNGTSKAPSMETDYFYDVLNNLLTVNQWGQSSGTSGAREARTFSYDSLSRLLTSLNPETGLNRYSYDPNGNVISRIDARGVITNYVYDYMNRLLSKTYPGEVSGTPLSCYQYSVSTSSCPSGNGYWIGRLTNAWTQSASTSCSSAAPTTGFLTKRSILCYDPMGRITSELQYTPASIASGKLYAPQYSYDLAGILAYSTDGVTPNPTPSVQLPSCSVQAPSWIKPTLLNFANCYDGAGRLQMLASNWAVPNLASSQMLFSQPNYFAFGGLQSAFIGNSTLTMNRKYDNRLRLYYENDAGSVVGSATAGSAVVTITGLEQSK